MYYYQCFGLKLKSSIEIPGIRQLKQSDKTDITIRFGEIPNNLANSKLVNSNENFQIKSQQALIKFPNIAKFLTQNGNEIIIQKQHNITDELVAAFVQADPMSLLLQQRKLLILHGSSVKIEDKCVAFLAPSGTGKSTTAAAFKKLGFKILTDDLCLVNLNDNGITVTPSFPRIRLHDSSVTKLQLTTQELVIPENSNYKKVMPLLQQGSYLNNCKLDKIYILDKTECSEVSIRQINGTQKLAALINNVFRREYLRPQGLESLMLQKLQQLAKSITVYKIQRPEGKFLLDELVASVLTTQKEVNNA